MSVVRDMPCVIFLWILATVTLANHDNRRLSNKISLANPNGYYQLYACDPQQASDKSCKDTTPYCFRDQFNYLSCGGQPNGCWELLQGGVPVSIYVCPPNSQCPSFGDYKSGCRQSFNGEIPSSQPSGKPRIPSITPSLSPSIVPSMSSSAFPSNTPRITPLAYPSNIPTSYIAPSSRPYANPSIAPTYVSTLQPSVLASTSPTVSVSSVPSTGPSMKPSCLPTHIPTAWPIANPSDSPSNSPTTRHSLTPSTTPSVNPSSKPSITTSASPSLVPTLCITFKWLFYQCAIIGTIGHSYSFRSKQNNPTRFLNTTAFLSNGTATSQYIDSHNGLGVTGGAVRKNTIDLTNYIELDLTFYRGDSMKILFSDSGSKTPYVSVFGSMKSGGSLGSKSQKLLFRGATYNFNYTIGAYRYLIISSSACLVNSTADAFMIKEVAITSCAASLQPTSLPAIAPQTLYPSLEPSFSPSVIPMSPPSNSPSLNPNFGPPTKPSAHPLTLPTIIPSTSISCMNYQWAFFTCVVFGNISNSFSFPSQENSPTLLLNVTAFNAAGITESLYVDPRNGLGVFGPTKSKNLIYTSNYIEFDLDAYRGKILTAVFSASKQPLVSILGSQTAGGVLGKRGEKLLFRGQINSFTYEIGEYRYLIFTGTECFNNSFAGAYMIKEIYVHCFPVLPLPPSQSSTVPTTLSPTQSPSKTLSQNSSYFPSMIPSALTTLLPSALPSTTSTNFPTFCEEYYWIFFQCSVSGDVGHSYSFPSRQYSSTVYLNTTAFKDDGTTAQLYVDPRSGLGVYGEPISKNLIHTANYIEFDLKTYKGKILRAIFSGSKQPMVSILGSKTAGGHLGKKGQKLLFRGAVDNFTYPIEEYRFLIFTGTQCFNNSFSGAYMIAEIYIDCSPVTTSLPSRFPSPASQPSSLPSTQPSMLPSSRPSILLSSQPSMLPSSQPSVLPSSQPSILPSSQPLMLPSSQPSMLPSTKLSSLPSSHPSSPPSTQPSSFPSTLPSSPPSTQPSPPPSIHPSSLPSTQPSAPPSTLPSSPPSTQPSAPPTNQPSSKPSTHPSSLPSTHPSSLPSTQPSSPPSTQPSSPPSTDPSLLPSTQHSLQPTSQPSTQLTTHPSSMPSIQPSLQPSIWPPTVNCITPHLFFNLTGNDESVGTSAVFAADNNLNCHLPTYGFRTDGTAVSLYRDLFGLGISENIMDSYHIDINHYVEFDFLKYHGSTVKLTLTGVKTSVAIFGTNSHGGSLDSQSLLFNGTTKEITLNNVEYDYLLVSSFEWDGCFHIRYVEKMCGKLIPTVSPSTNSTQNLSGFQSPSPSRSPTLPTTFTPSAIQSTKLFVLPSFVPSTGPLFQPSSNSSITTLASLSNHPFCNPSTKSSRMPHVKSFASPSYRPTYPAISFIPAYSIPECDLFFNLTGNKGALGSKYIFEADNMDDVLLPTYGYITDGTPTSIHQNSDGLGISENSLDSFHIDLNHFVELDVSQYQNQSKSIKFVFAGTVLSVSIFGANILGSELGNQTLLYNGTSSIFYSSSIDYSYLLVTSYDWSGCFYIKYVEICSTPTVVSV